MTVKLSAIVILLSMLTTLRAEVLAYQLPVTREGKTQTRLAYAFWSGEYPQPVINVGADKNGTTKIQGFKSLRALNDKIECTIANGIYHPWSKTHSSINIFYTVVAVDEYLSLSPQQLDEVKLPKDTKISNVIYLAEGSCQASIKERAQGIVFQCDELDDTSRFKKISSPQNWKPEQWLLLNCNERHQAFVRDSDLLTQPGVTEGQIKGYGEVEAKK